MVTLALLAMSGLIGMAVDFGWSFFVRREAQAAADSAALSAARAALDLVRANGESALSCSTLSCGSETSCSGLTGNWQSACLYAQQNGFTVGGDSGRQNVTVAAGVYSPTPGAPPTAPNVNVNYWVTVRVSVTIPQLYSALLGNAASTVAARATAAIVNELVNGSIISLNREGDPQPAWQQTANGNNPDLLIGPGSNIYANTNPGGGIMLSSNDAGSGTNLGSISPTAPLTSTRGGLTPLSSWASTRTYTSQADGTQFQDPFTGLGQPPLPTSAFQPTQYYAAPNGNLAASPGCVSGTCLPGVYYATVGGTPSGGPLIIASSTLNFASSNNGWGDYVFYGGLNITGSNVAFGPGRYVLGGIDPTQATTSLSITGGSQITGGSNGGDPGRMFISTQPDYPGLSTVAPPPAGMPTMSFGQVDINPGSSGSVVLHGLNSAQNLPSDSNSQGYTLNDFGPLAVWQDQRYSNITTPTNTAPQIVIGSNVSVDGVFYQPRGAWLQAQPGTQLNGVYRGARLISGALDVGSGSDLFLCGGSGCSQALPLWTRVVALVE